jgi:hypothetical protein
VVLGTRVEEYPGVERSPGASVCGRLLKVPKIDGLHIFSLLLGGLIVWAYYKFYAKKI